jgi:hypothetical protein
MNCIVLMSIHHHRLNVRASNMPDRLLPCSVFPWLLCAFHSYVFETICGDDYWRNFQQLRQFEAPAVGGCTTHLIMDLVNTEESLYGRKGGMGAIRTVPIAPWSVLVAICRYSWWKGACVGGVDRGRDWMRQDDTGAGRSQGTGLQQLMIIRVTPWACYPTL